jgi:ABC-type antimicrobial peptide transport system permease subunit
VSSIAVRIVAYLIAGFLTFGAKVLLQGMVLALAMGVIGGLFPAIRVTRLEISNALRHG